MVPAELKKLAHDLIQVSAEVIRGYYRSGLAIDDKSDASPVTRADRETETAMRKLIFARRPQDGIIGEEHGRENEDAEWVWVLDPIDGTKAFITGRPLFVTLIGLLHFGKPVLGVINQPITHDCWVGVVGEGTTLNGVAAHVSQITELASARIGSTGPQYYKPEGLEVFNALAAKCRFAVWGGDGYQFGLLASGGMDIAVESGIKLHDFAALAPVVIGAGGLMTDWQGKALDRCSGGDVVAAATPELHMAALEYLKQ